MGRGLVAVVLTADLLVVPVTPLAGANGSVADEFRNVKLMVNVGNKATETSAVLRFEEGRLVVTSEAGTELKAMQYEELKSAEYSYSKGPRWKTGIATAVAFGIFALPVFFMKGKKHWLTVQTGSDYALLRLDKNNYKIILPAFEARTGLKVEVVSEEQ